MKTLIFTGDSDHKILFARQYKYKLLTVTSQKIIICPTLVRTVWEWFEENVWLVAVSVLKNVWLVAVSVLENIWLVVVVVVVVVAGQTIWPISSN